MERTIISNLAYNEQYARKVVAYLKEEYFHDHAEKVVYKIISDYFLKYNSLPTKEVITVELDNLSIPQQVFDTGMSIVQELHNENTDLDWLLENTESFCQDKAIYNTIMESISIIDGTDKQRDRGALPEMLQKALSVSFDTSIGHDFVENAEERFEFYNRVEERIPFDLELLNKITNGGLVKKSITVLLAGTGVGKSLFMCHMAAHNLMMGKNVLYITMEMSEERIAERIDANLMNIPINQIKELSQDSYGAKIKRIAKKTQGKLIIKEYPTGSAHSGHFRHLINELKTKKNFVPDIIYIDYLNLCSSFRAKSNNNINSYTMVKMITEELRGLAIEFNLPVVTATQVNRGGMGSSDIELTDVSESVGITHTADLMFALISTEELDDMEQVLIKQLKNRYNDLNYYRKFVIGIDKSKMRLYDVEQNAQDDIINAGSKDDETLSVFDKSSFGDGLSAEKKDKIKSLFNS